ncbi:MAG: hypothetical protein OXC41_02320 [Gammaproteobacteria bacterium]|nr:hypothetical protein [Gammaproteobacteria bacterium]
MKAAYWWIRKIMKKMFRTLVLTALKVSIYALLLEAKRTRWIEANFLLSRF